MKCSFVDVNLGISDCGSLHNGPCADNAVAVFYNLVLRVILTK